MVRLASTRARMFRLALAAMALTARCCTAAHAGAWLQDKGHWQIIASFEASRANGGFDAQGHLDPTIKFDKLYVKCLVEYGWSDRVTLFAAPQYVIATSQPGRAQPITSLGDGAIEVGARVRLFHTFGVASFESSYTSAGPSDLSNSRRLDSAQVSELRLLYGTNYRLLGRNGFLDLEAAERFVSRPRPDETVLDATAGLWLNPKTLLLVQSFNTVSGANAMPPDTAFASNKVEVSMVRRLSERWSLQLGSFAVPAGRDALMEQGVVAAFWARL